MGKIIEKADEIGIHAIVGKLESILRTHWYTRLTYTNCSIYYNWEFCVIEFVHQVGLQIHWYI
jgi:hypothetical protein